MRGGGRAQNPSVNLVKVGVSLWNCWAGPHQGGGARRRPLAGALPLTAALPAHLRAAGCPGLGAAPKGRLRQVGAGASGSARHAPVRWGNRGTSSGCPHCHAARGARDSGSSARCDHPPPRASDLPSKVTASWAWRSRGPTGCDCGCHRRRPPALHPEPQGDPGGQQPRLLDKRVTPGHGQPRGLGRHTCRLPGRPHGPGSGLRVKGSHGRRGSALSTGRPRRPRHVQL